MYKFQTASLFFGFVGFVELPPAKEIPFSTYAFTFNPIAWLNDYFLNRRISNKKYRMSKVALHHFCGSLFIIRYSSFQDVQDWGARILVS